MNSKLDNLLRQLKHVEDEEPVEIQAKEDRKRVKKVRRDFNDVRDADS